MVKTCKITSGPHKGAYNAPKTTSRISCFNRAFSSQNLTLPLTIQTYAFKDYGYAYVLIIVIPPNLTPINLFFNLYLFTLNKLFGKCKWGISLHVKRWERGEVVISGEETASVEIYHTTESGTFGYSTEVS